MDLSTRRYSSEIPDFGSLTRSAPKGFIAFQNELKNVPAETIKNSIVIEFYTDNMVSFGALILTKELCPLSLNNDRIHILRVSPETYNDCTNFLNAIDSKLEQKRVFNIYEITKKPNSSPIRYIIFNFTGKSFALFGLECLRTKAGFLKVEYDTDSTIASIVNFLNFLRKKDHYEILNLMIPD